jgi:hypothetical protein
VCALFDVAYLVAIVIVDFLLLLVIAVVGDLLIGEGIW